MVTLWSTQGFKGVWSKVEEGREGPVGEYLKVLPHFLTTKKWKSPDGGEDLTSVIILRNLENKNVSQKPCLPGRLDI